MTASFYHLTALALTLALWAVLIVAGQTIWGM